MRKKTCLLPFPLEFEAEINESVALMARNGSPEWEGGPSQRVPIPMADSGHLLQGTKGDEGKNKLILLSAAKNLNVYLQLRKVAKGRCSLC